MSTSGPRAWQGGWRSTLPDLIHGRRSRVPVVSPVQRKDPMPSPRRGAPRRSPVSCALLLALTLLALAGCSGADETASEARTTAASDPHAGFLANLSDACGQAFPGVVTTAPPGYLYFSTGPNWSSSSGPAPGREPGGWPGPLRERSAPWRAPPPGGEVR